MTTTRLHHALTLPTLGGSAGRNPKSGSQDMVKRGLSTLSTALAAYATWRRQRKAVAELRRLDDRTLRDLGLHRSEIRMAVRYGTDRRSS